MMQRIAAAMERIAPLRLAESWDNVGLLVEAPWSPRASRPKVFLTNDLTHEVRCTCRFCAHAH